MFCAGRVADDDLNRVSQATGAVVQTTTSGIPNKAVGKCELFEERQVGGERFNFFTGCPFARTSTFVLRGGSEQFVEEAHRSLHDALMVVKRSKENMHVVAGGGAIEMELSRHVREHARLIEGKQQLVMLSFAKALEIIPRQICDNAGLNSTDILNMLRQKHAQDPVESVWYGVDVNKENICDTFNSHVWEPSSNKTHSISSAAEAACLILSVDETVRNPQSEQQQGAPGGHAPPGGGMPMSAAMGGQGLRGMAQNGMPGVRSIRGRGGK
jgi:T-complex protein 1 subunit eta